MTIGNKENQQNNSSTNTTPFKQSHSTDTTLCDLWYIPYVSHFIWLFQKQLNMPSITVTQYEHALQNSDTDTNMHILLTRILLSRIERNKLSKSESWDYNILCDVIQTTFAFWFDQNIYIDADNYELNSGGEYDIDSTEVSIEYSYARIVQSQYQSNPLHNCTFNELSAAIKAQVIYTICEYYLFDTEGEFIDHLRSLEPADCRVESIGSDNNKSMYYYFGFNDYRVYKCTLTSLQLLQRSYSNSAQSNTMQAQQPQFKLMTHNSDELNKLIRKFKHESGKTQNITDLIVALEQVVEICDSESGHTGTSSADQPPNKKPKLSSVQVPQRGSARLVQSMIEQQHKLQLEAELDAVKRTRRANELVERAQQYKTELIEYYRILRNAIKNSDNL